MLTETKIKENLAKYLHTCEKYGFLSDKLTETIGLDLLTSPATTSNQFYRAYEGGLVEHILSLTKFAVNINKTLPENMAIDQKTLVKVCLLHQLGKVGMFSKTDNGYTFSNIPPMKVSERSIMYACKLGIPLSDDEISAIYSHDRPSDDKTPVNLLGEVIKMANTLAIKEFKLSN